MEQNLKNCEEILKEIYLPVWRNQLNTEPSPLLAKIKSVPLTGNKIVATAPIGLSGGFGFGEEGMATPAAGHVNYERFETNAKDMYVNMCISVKTVRLAKEPGAMLNALEAEIKASYEAAKWNVGRSLFGNGTGKLAKCSAQSSGPSKTVEVDSVKYLIEGLTVDFYNDSNELKHTARITSINRTDKGSSKYDITIDKQPSAQLEAGFVTVQNSYNREITGLGAIFDDTITKIYDVSKTEQPFLKPITYDAGDTIDDGIITKVLRQAKNVKNSNIDMLLCGDSAYDEYVTYLRTNNIRVEDRTGEIDGGFKSLKFLFGNKTVDIVSEQFIPDEEIWGIDTTTMEFHKQEWDFETLQGGSIFNLMENTSVYRALMANYGDLICTNPGGCVRIYNCV